MGDNNWSYIICVIKAYLILRFLASVTNNINLLQDFLCRRFILLPEEVVLIFLIFIYTLAGISFYIVNSNIKAYIVSVKAYSGVL